jgi:signal transduction histidine kinase
VQLPRPRRRSVVALDVVVAAGLVAFSVYALGQPWDDGFRVHAGWLDVVAVSAMAAPYALRTLAPALGLGLVLAANAAAGLVGPHTVLFYSFFPPLAVLVYAVARHDDGWAGRWTLAAVPLLVLGDAGVPEFRALPNVVFAAVCLAPVWLGGRVVRRMAQQNERLAEATARLALEREAGEREAVALERGRIAAEMHDVVGHALSLMVLQTGAARAVLTSDGADATVVDGLREAEETGRAALDDLRRTVGAVRRGVPLRVEADPSPR